MTTTTVHKPWRTSSYTDGVTCVAVQDRGDTIAVRNTNRVQDGEIAVDRAAMAGFLAAVKDGEFDDLA